MHEITKSRIKVAAGYFLFGIAAILFSKGDMWLLSVTMLYISSLYLIVVFFKLHDRRRIIFGLYVYQMIICILAYTLIYKKLGILDSQTLEVATSLKDFIYFSVVTWTTLGYGDFKPSPEARLYAASQAVLGYLYMSILVAKLFHWFGGNSTSSNK